MLYLMNYKRDLRVTGREGTLLKKAQIKRLATNRILKGYPVLEEYDFSDFGSAKEGDFVRLVDPKQKFVAIGYLGNEKRNVGWVLTLEDEEITTSFVSQLFEEAKEKRNAYFTDNQTTAFRVFNSDGDGLGGLTIDYYEGYYVFTWYSQGIYEHRDMVLEAFEQVFTNYEGVYEKNNYKQATVKSQHVLGKEAPEPLVVKENGISFATYLNEGRMTGIFLDQRNVRKQIMFEYGVGNTVLNLFSYTGAFSVAAAMGGAIKTVSVDVANRSQEKTKEQFEINGLNPDDHEIRVIDVDSYLDYAQKHELAFDVIVVDPPTFARSKEGTFSVEEDYTDLVKNTLTILKPGGILIAATNTWKLSRDDFYGLISDGFNESGLDGYLVEEFALPDDFTIHANHPESNYLKVFVIEKQ